MRMMAVITKTSTMTVKDAPVPQVDENVPQELRDALMHDYLKALEKMGEEQEAEWIEKTTIEFQVEVPQ